MTIPKWLQKSITKEQLEKIESAIALAEKTTQAEIVPVIVKKTSSWGKSTFEKEAINNFNELVKNKTNKSVGVLIMVSWKEHKVIVLADEAIHNYVPLSSWDTTVELITSSAKKNCFAEGLVAAIHQVAEVCSKVMPSVANDVNELPNHLVIKE